MTNKLTLAERIVAAHERLDQLRGADSAQIDSQQLLEELSNSLEELHVSADEIAAQEELLWATRDDIERERRRYLELFELAPDAYFVTDARGLIVEANNAAATLVHRRQHFLIGKPMSVFVASGPHAEFYEMLASIQRGGAERINDLEIELMLHDGTQVNVAITAAAIYERPDKFSGIRWLLRDVTERKRIEAIRDERIRLAAFRSDIGLALTESGPVQAALQRCAGAMVEHLRAALARIWTVNDTGQTLELQATAGLYTHLDGRIAPGKLKVDRIAQECRPQLTNDLVGDAHVSDQDWVKREKLVAFAGYPLIIESRLVGVMAMFARQPLGDDILHALGAAAHEVALGIEHKRTEQRLAGALRQIEHIMETVPEIMYTLDVDTRLIRWNRKLETATGFSPQELSGRKAISFFSEAAQAAVNNAIREAFTTGYSEVEADLLGKDGTTVPYHWNAAPLKDEHGRVIGLTGAGRDISERKKADRALSQLSSRLIQLQDEERRRIGRELHDSTAQNLAGLAMNLSLIQQSRQRLSQGERRALTESRKLVDLCLQEIRTISYLLHPPLLDEIGLASAIRWYAEGFAQRSGIRVDLMIVPELGRLREEAETTLFRIVQECLTNAHRHSGSPTVGIQILRDARTITLEVSDEGSGLAAAAAASNEPPVGVGIMGMRERMKQLGGYLEIIPREHGLAVRATMPVTAAAP